MRGNLRLPHPKPLTSSTLQMCPHGTWWRVLLTPVTGLASAEQHRPRREADGMGHQKDELLRHEPAHVAHRQPDLLQVISQPNLSWSDACLTTLPEVHLGGRRMRDDLLLLLHLDECRMVALAILVRLQGVGESRGHVILQPQNTNDLTAACSNSHHFDENSELATWRESWLLASFTRVCLNFIHFDTLSRIQGIWLPSIRVLVTPAVYPRVFEILTILTFGALRKNHIVSTAFETIAKTKNAKDRYKRKKVAHVRSVMYHESSRTQPKFGNGTLRGKNQDPTSTTIPQKKRYLSIVDTLTRREFSVHDGLELIEKQ